MAGDGRTFFFQWEVLNYLRNVNDTKVIKLGKMFNVKVKGGRKRECRKYGLGSESTLPISVDQVSIKSSEL